MARTPREHNEQHKHDGEENEEKVEKEQTEEENNRRKKKKSWHRRGRDASSSSSPITHSSPRLNPSYVLPKFFRSVTRVMTRPAGRVRRSLQNLTGQVGRGEVGSDQNFTTGRVGSG